MVPAPMLHTPTVLLYAPGGEREVDYQAALEDAGYRVVRSSTIAGCEPYLDGGADLILLHDPPWELARTLVAALDRAPLPVARIWVSSWSRAPALAGKLGVDALLLEPRDVAAVVERVGRALVPAHRDADVPPPWRGLRRAEHTAPEALAYRGALDRFDDETSDHTL